MIDGGEMQLSIQHQELNIRRFIESDRDDFINLVQHPLCMKYSITGVLSEQQACDYFEQLINNQKLKMYVIEDLSDATVIGFTGLQDCFIDQNIEPSFILKLLPDIHQHQDLRPLLQQLIKKLIPLYQLTHLQSVVSQKNSLNMQLMSDLNFERKKSIICRGIPSYLYIRS